MFWIFWIILEIGVDFSTVGENRGSDTSHLMPLQELRNICIPLEDGTNTYIRVKCYWNYLSVFSTEVESLIWCLREVFKSYDKWRKRRFLQGLLLLLKLVRDTVTVPKKSVYFSWAFFIVHIKEKIDGFRHLASLKLSSLPNFHCFHWNSSLRSQSSTSRSENLIKFSI